MKYRLLSLILMILFLSCGDQDTIVQSLLDISGAPLVYDDSGADLHLNAASVCMQCSPDKEENLQKVLNFIREIMEANPETRLIVFGETILGRYYGLENPEEYMRSIAETIPGPATDAVGHLADSLNVFIAFGLAELSGDTLFNSLVLMNPDGMLEARHRKVHFVNTDETAGFTPGRHVTTADIDGIKTGLIICADVSGAWITRNLVKKKPKLIIHSLASLANTFPIDAVARQFNAWVIFANRVGKEGDDVSPGACYISDPAGTIRAGGEGPERYITYRIGVYQ